MIDQKTLKELLQYSPETGIFTWRKRGRKWFTSDRIWRSWNTRYAGTEAGCNYKEKRNNYIYIDVFSKRTAAHRMAFIYMGLKINEADCVDHINGNGTDNRAYNLRIASNSENCRNQRKRTNNSSGVTGVRKDSQWGGWVASIGVNGKNIYLGYYQRFCDAAAAREEAEIKYKYAKRHGK